ncbi:hypothetical protein E3N88_28451 [Mikania micrantha]|uniref:DUF674 domain-containing protein n=1 Tax=Mikania micrantha TaxID=192012 RepID=A0A5N6N0P0_9ASTR|nr:hypothetical protein E3N88_28451 [Mikania micrantha]
MVHKKEQRVIFAEADSNFVDTLFSIMTLPLATIVRLLRKVPDEKLKPIGSLNNLYQSLLNLSTNCLSSEENKWLMLYPKTSSHDACRKLRLNINDEEPTEYYICEDIDCSRRYGTPFSTCNLARCKYCGKMMNKRIKYEDTTVVDNGCSGVFASDLTSFMVTDDLRVTSNSPGSMVQLLCELGIPAVTFLDEMTFDVGLDQILNLLKGAMLFKNPLTYMVFPSSPSILDLVKPGKEILLKHLTAETSKSLTLTVTAQKSSSKCLFADANSDFVECLFGFLEIPLGYMIGELMNGSSSFESLNNLYSSISSMATGEYIKSFDLKNMLLHPKLMHTKLSKKQIFPLSVFHDSNYCHTYLECGIFSAYMTPCYCPKGHEKEMLSSCYLKDSRVDGRYLKESAKFMVTDDLVITPLSLLSSTTMLSKLNVPLNDVEVHKVSIGIEEGLEILDASLKSFSTFTDSILKKITLTR